MFLLFRSLEGRVVGEKHVRHPFLEHCVSSPCVQNVARASKELKTTVSELKDVVRGYKELAAAKVPQDKINNRDTVSIASVALHASGLIRGRSTVPVLSVAVQVQRDRDYADLPYVAKVHPMIKFVGGINAPKKVVVEDSKGKV